MSVTRLIESYVSDHNASLVEQFLFADVTKPTTAVLEAIDDSLAVLLGFQLLDSSSGSSAEMVEVSKEKLESMIDNGQTRARMEILNAYLAHTLKAKRGDISLPSRSPWRLIVAIAAHILRLSTYIRSKYTNEDVENFYQLVQKARQIAQRLMQSQARRHARWVEGLTYIWQAFGIGSTSDTKNRDQVLLHVRCPSHVLTSQYHDYW